MDGSSARLLRAFLERPNLAVLSDALEKPIVRGGFISWMCLLRVRGRSGGQTDPASRSDGASINHGSDHATETILRVPHTWFAVVEQSVLRHYVAAVSYRAAEQGMGT
jgi:hypothetical protein